MPSEDDGHKKSHAASKEGTSSNQIGFDLAQFNLPATIADTLSSLRTEAYHANEGDDVIGVVIRRVGEAMPDIHYLVDIGAHSLAMLNALAFDGATKRNKPDLQLGDLVFARIMSTGVRIQPALTCVNRRGWGKGWGPLRKSGFTVTVPADFAEKFYVKNTAENNMLKALGKYIRFEVAIGANGIIWIDAKNNEFIKLQLVQFFEAAQAVRNADEASRLCDVIIDNCQTHVNASDAWG